jgi:hypothetical protein
MGFNDPEEEKIGAHDKNIVHNITKFQVINAHFLNICECNYTKFKWQDSFQIVNNPHK